MKVKTQYEVYKTDSNYKTENVAIFDTEEEADNYIHDNHWKDREAHVMNDYFIMRHSFRLD